MERKQVRAKIRYSSDVTDREWEIIETLLPQKKKTRPPVWTKRQILNGIFYQLKNGCNWGDLPRDMPPNYSVFWDYKQWCEDGIFKKYHDGVTWKSVRKNQKKYGGRPRS
jgi:transposase